MKKTVAAIVLVVFLTASLCVFSLPHVKANASEAKVLTHSWYTAPSSGVLASSAGDLVVVGEIQNVGSNIIQNVTVTGSAFSADGTALGTAQGEALVYQTSPGERALNKKEGFAGDVSTLSGVQGYSLSELDRGLN